MNFPIKDQVSVKQYIIDTLSNQGNNMEVGPLLDAARDSKIKISFNKPVQVIKQVTLGQETIPRIGSIDIMSNDFWDLQDIGFKQLFPELTDTIDNFEFVVIKIDDVKFNKGTNKVEIIQKRQKFWFKNETKDFS